MSEIDKKARRRIRRYIRAKARQVVQAEVHVPRVRHIGGRIYEYKVKHHVTSIFFKHTRFGRLKKVMPN